MNESTVPVKERYSSYPAMPSQSNNQDSHASPSTSEPFGLGAAMHYATVGIVLPCIGLLWGIESKPDWQSGMLRDHARLFMLPNVTWPFWPLFAFAFSALAVLVSDIPRHSRSRWVRIGLVLGIVLGAQFTIIQWCAMGIGLTLSFLPGICIGATVILWGELASSGDRSSSDWKVGKALDLTVLGSVTLIVLFLLVWGVFFIAYPSPEDDAQVGSPFLFLLVGWPTALLVTCTMARARARISVALHEQGRAPKVSVNVALGLLASYATAWAFAISRELAEYDRLPIQPPPDDCYVANAACRGHRAWVRSEWVEPADRPPFLVNPQLRTLKTGELVLRAVMPCVHKALRRVYDSIGPRLATRIRSAWLADIAYAVLVPVTLVTRAVLLIARVDSRVRRW